MKRDLLLVFAFVLGGPLAALPQSKSPEIALEEIATADKLDALAHHLPAAIEENVTHLSPVQKAALEDEIVVPRVLARSGQILHKRDDGNWEFQLNPTRPPELVHVKNTFYSGGDALVLLESADQDALTALVSMRYEDSEWRVTDFGFLHMLGIEARLQEKFRPCAKQETDVLDALEEMEVALNNYARIYPQLGFPTRLQVLGPDPNEAAQPSDVVIAESSITSSDTDQEQSENTQASSESEQHAGLLDATFMPDPLILHGYRFQYKLIAAHGSGESDSRGQFSITATPVDFGKSGSRSFYLDDSHTIHFTDDNRDATVNDPPLQRPSGYGNHVWLR
jgi:hypothetical protein